MFTNKNGMCVCVCVWGGGGGGFSVTKYNTYLYINIYIYTKTYQYINAKSSQLCFYFHIQSLPWARTPVINWAVCLRGYDRWLVVTLLEVSSNPVRG